MADEVDRIVEKHGFYGNRQRFIETAIQEKIEKVRLTETVKHDARWARLKLFLQGLK